MRIACQCEWWGGGVVKRGETPKRGTTTQGRALVLGDNYVNLERSDLITVSVLFVATAL